MSTLTQDDTRLAEQVEEAFEDECQDVDHRRGISYHTPNAPAAYLVSAHAAAPERCCALAGLSTYVMWLRRSGARSARSPTPQVGTCSTRWR